jgi:hypothetical protein
MRREDEVKRDEMREKKPKEVGMRRDEVKRDIKRRGEKR